MFLHLNHYTHWLWKQDLHNMMHFLKLRDHFHAQIEAQKYAQACDYLIRQQLPVSMGLYDEYRRMKLRHVKAWLVEHPEHERSLEWSSPSGDCPLTDADRAAGWTGTALWMET